MNMHRGSFESAPGFILGCIKWTLVHCQMNPGALSIKPQKQIELNQGSFFKVKNTKKSIFQKYIFIGKSQHYEN